MTFLTNTHSVSYYLVIVFVLTGLHVIITADNAASMAEDSYISLQNEILNRPVIKNKMPLRMSGQRAVSMAYVPFQITGVDEIKQIVHISALVTLLWNYTQIAWDPKDYHNQSSFTIDSSSVWVPKIAMPKSGDGPWVEIPDSLELSTFGFLATIPIPITTACELDLTFFPFDSHNCSMAFIEMQEYDLESVPNITSLVPFFSTSSEWILTNYSCESVSEPPITAYIKCWHTMKRRSDFYVAVVITPLVIFSITTHFVFIIPAQSGEKSSFIVSLFVSMNIFIAYVNGIIPRSMARIPRILFIIGHILLHMVMCMLASFFVIRRYHAHLERDQRISEKEVHAHNGAVGSDTKCPVTEMNVKNLDDNTGTKESDPTATRSFICLNRVDPLNHDISLGNGGHDHIGDRKGESTHNIPRRIYNWFADLSHTKLDIMFFVFFGGISIIQWWLILN